MREDLVKSAESFLSSETVKLANKEKKVQFLKQKGLNNEEIDEAFKRIEPTTTITTTNNANIPATNTAPRLPPRNPSLYQPVQIVYYPPPSVPRMDLAQTVRIALTVGIGAIGITVAATAIIRTIMSRILNAIARYQGNRYNEQAKILSRMESALKEFSKTIDNNSIEKEQSRFCQSLDKVVETIKLSSEDRSFKKCLSALQRFKNSLINDPLISSSSSSYESRVFGGYSGFTNAYAERYQVNADQNNIIQSIKSDIRSVKGSLLSRRNFPTALKSTVQTIIPESQTSTFIPPPPTVEDPYAHHPRNKSFRRELQNN